MGGKHASAALAIVCAALGFDCTTRPVSSLAPATKTLVEVPLTQGAVSKVDLLFAIDNSSSMGDKQALLREAVPDLLKGLLNPRCVDPIDETTVLGRSVEGRCARGKPEFEPIKDLHVAVVTSSLSEGPGVCEGMDQKAHLLGGVMSWTLGGAKSQADLAREVEDQIVAAGEKGCGYEAQQESWYRFLIEPDPFEKIVADKDGVAHLVGTDATLLAQRAEFLRPDSLVAVVQISDENESTPDPTSLGGLGYEYGDPEFKTDPRDLRFFHMKERFGVDPMFPLSRYVLGLTSKQVKHRDQKTTCRNPLFAAKLPAGAGQELCNLPRGTRTSNLVFFAAITGVAPDLLHFDPDDENKSKLTDADWRAILGRDPLAYDFGGADPRMLESVTPRGVAGDWDTKGVSLQYACTFDLDTPRLCPGGTSSGCDCDQDPSAPVCDRTNPQLQTKARAFPGVRHLALAKELGAQGIVASVCPTDTKNKSPDNARYGYRPAMKVILDALRNELAVQCLPHPPQPDAQGQAPCIVLEVLPEGQGTCDQPDKGLKPADPEVERAFRQEQAATGKDLSRAHVCSLEQLTPRDGVPCKARDEAGWCYAQDAEALAATRQKCHEAIVFTRGGNPASGVTTTMRCIEQAN